ncbi:MAG: DUF6134 family protein [Actinomycetota bacterium]
MLRFRPAVFGLALAVLPAAAFAVETPGDLSFTVLRNGEPVGTHVVRFRPEANGLDVAIDTNVVVKIAMIPVYRFEHHGHETWRADHLETLESKTNDDGTHHTLAAHAAPGGLEVVGDGSTSRLPAGVVPASLWNRATVAQASLMNTLDGHGMTVKITDLGPETVAVHGVARPAHHYAMAGDLARELWYDDAGTLVQVRFKAKDDSDIRYVLN